MDERREVSGTAVKIEPHMLAILARKFNVIVNEMNHTLEKVSRSAALNLAKDFSSAVLTSEGDLFCLTQAIPIIVASCSMAAKQMTGLFGDLRPGDCFLNNSPYYGSSHHGDFAYMAPVFYKGEHILTTLSVAHQADIGNSQPTTFMPFAKDLYEEGALDFPCVRVQRDYADVEDVVRMAKIRIRNPEQWYGDYLAAVGAVRIGEKRIIELCDKYGAATIKAFLAEWQDYSRRRMVDEIGRLPRRSWEATNAHDPIEGLAPDGIPLKVKLSILPEEGKIQVDLRDNIACLEAGYNLSEATTRSAVVTGILNNLSSDLPRNDGVYNCIEILARENAIVGGVQPPYSTSMATVGVAARLINLIQSMFAELGPDKGLAEGATSFSPSVASVCGKDFRYDDRLFVNAVIYGFGGGPALHGHDGWLTYLGPPGGCQVDFISAEIFELKMPILFGCCEVETDSGGAGEWDGAPGIRCLMRPRGNPALWSYFLDSKVFPPKGLHGGHAGAPSAAWKVDAAGNEVAIPDISSEEIQPTEWIGSLWPGGGGFGDPLDRDPERVRHRVRNGWVSPEKARGVYGVALDLSGEDYRVDQERTAQLRLELRNR